MRRRQTLLVGAVLILAASCSNQVETGSPSTVSVAPDALRTTFASSQTTNAWQRSTTTTPSSSTLSSNPTITESPEPTADDAEIEFVAGVREEWERNERTLGAPIPDVTDDEIVEIGEELCGYLAQHPLDFSREEADQAMTLFADAAAIISDRLGITYDPALLDAGFESQAAAATVIAFRYVGDKGWLDDPPRSPKALCPEVDPRADAGGLLFIQPWTIRAVAEDS